jgi:hypothetical protein
MSIRITCITKAAGDHENPFVAISRLGWVNLLNPSEKKSSFICKTLKQVFDL